MKSLWNRTAVVYCMKVCFSMDSTMGLVFSIGRTVSWNTAAIFATDNFMVRVTIMHWMATLRIPENSKMEHHTAMAALFIPMARCTMRANGKWVSAVAKAFSAIRTERLPMKASGKRIGAMDTVSSTYTGSWFMKVASPGEKCWMSPGT